MLLQKTKELQSIAYQTVNSLDFDFLNNLTEQGKTVDQWTKELLNQLNSIGKAKGDYIEDAFESVMKNEFKASSPNSVFLTKTLEEETRFPFSSFSEPKNDVSPKRSKPNSPTLDLPEISYPAFSKRSATSAL